MLLFVGLGNPGEKYARHRHNVGFMALDAIQRRHGFGPWRRRFQGETAEGTVAGLKCLLLKPQTFMNKSGQAVAEAAGFFKVPPSDVVVVHDEVDLPPGKIRMKAGGGIAGHNGLRSIGAAFDDGFRRIRIGVGHPGNSDRVAGYVLHDFAKADSAWLDPLIDAVAEHFPLLVEGKDATFANRIHETLRPRSGPGATPAGADTPARAKAEPKAGSAPESAGPLARGLKRLFGLGG